MSDYFPLLQLPGALVEIIAFKLSSREIIRLQSTCKLLYNHFTSSEFLNEFSRIKNLEISSSAQLPYFFPLLQLPGPALHSVALNLSSKEIIFLQCACKLLYNHLSSYEFLGEFTRRKSKEISILSRKIPSRAQRIGEQSFTQLPYDLFHDICNRMPTLSIIKMQSTCNEYYHHFTSEEFFSEHARKWMISRNYLVMRTRHNSIIFKSQDDSQQAPLNAFESSSLFPEGLATEIVGVINGIICISSYPDLFLWNPLRNMCLKLPREGRFFGGESETCALSLCLGTYHVVTASCENERILSSFSMLEEKWECNLYPSHIQLFNNVTVSGIPIWRVVSDSHPYSHLVCIRYNGIRKRFENRLRIYTNVDTYRKTIQLLESNGRLCYFFRSSRRSLSCVSHIYGSW